MRYTGTASAIQETLRSAIDARGKDGPAMNGGRVTNFGVKRPSGGSRAARPFPRIVVTTTDGSEERNDQMDTVHEEALAAAGTRPDGTIDLNAAMRSLLEGLLNAVMDEQASEAGAQRNGYRERSLGTCVGRVTLRIPKLRRGTYFPDDVVERRSRTDTALASAICEMWVGGVSTRKVEAAAPTSRRPRTRPASSRSPRRRSTGSLGRRSIGGEWPPQREVALHRYSGHDFNDTVSS